MNPHNEAVRKALASATGALFELDDRGCTAACVVIRDGRARVLIAEPQAPLDGATYTAHIDGQGVQQIGTTQLAGCAVEWSTNHRSHAA